MVEVPEGEIVPTQATMQNLVVAAEGLVTTALQGAEAMEALLYSEQGAVLEQEVLRAEVPKLLVE